LPIRQWLESIHLSFGNLYGPALEDAGYNQLSFINGGDELFDEFIIFELFDNMMKTLRDSTGKKLPHYRLIERAARRALGLPHEAWEATTTNVPQFPSPVPPGVRVGIHTHFMEGELLGAFGEVGVLSCSKGPPPSTVASIATPAEEEGSAWRRDERRRAARPTAASLFEEGPVVASDSDHLDEAMAYEAPLAFAAQLAEDAAATAHCNLSTRSAEGAEALTSPAAFPIHVLPTEGPSVAVGDHMELTSLVEGFIGSWYEVKIVALEKEGDADIDAGKPAAPRALVAYTATPAEQEWVALNRLRPAPPPLAPGPTPTAWTRRLANGDQVELSYLGGWWEVQYLGRSGTTLRVLAVRYGNFHDVRPELLRPGWQRRTSDGEWTLMLGGVTRTISEVESMLHKPSSRDAQEVVVGPRRLTGHSSLEEDQMEEKMEQDSGKVWVQLNLAPAADGCLTAMLQVRAAAHAISADASGAGTTAKGKPKFKVGDRVQSRLANGQVWRWYLGTITSYHGYFNQAVGIDCDFKHVYAIMFDHGESEEYVIEALIRHPRAVAARSPPAMSFAAAAAGAAAAASCTDAAASSSAPSHPSGAGPNGATKSAERAAADMAVRTKPPPGWRTAPAADVAAPRLSARQARAPARLDPAEEQERSRQRASGSAVGKRRADEYAVQRIIEEQVSARPRTVIAFEPWAISSPP
jgi:hypothetical protein